MSQINNPSFHFKKMEQIKPKSSKKKEIIKEQKSVKFKEKQRDKEAKADSLRS